MSNVKESFAQSQEVDGFTVYKLKLSEYALVFDKLQKLPVMLAEFTDVDNAALLAALPRLVSTALPEVIEILAIATRTDAKELDDKMTPITAVHCLKAFFAINDFFALWEEIQTAVPSLPMQKEKPTKKQ